MTAIFAASAIAATAPFAVGAQDGGLGETLGETLSDAIGSVLPETADKDGAAKPDEADTDKASGAPAEAPIDPDDDFSELDPDARSPSAEVSAEAKAILAQMDEVIRALDSEPQRQNNNWQLTLDDRAIIVVTDTNADRMRIITPIASAADMPAEAMERLLQANFDTALDARYAIGQGLVWGTFVHPLSTLSTPDFASGILQVKSLADTFGTTFSSGALNYGGGDSGAIIENRLNELLEELERKRTT